MANDTRSRTSNFANGRREGESEPSPDRMGNAQTEISDSELSAEDLEALSSGATFFETVGYNSTGVVAEVCRLLGQLVKKIESLGDNCIYFLRCLVVALALVCGSYFLYEIFFRVRVPHNYDNDYLWILAILLLGPVICLFLDIVFSARTTSQREQVAQRYQDGHARENLTYENTPSSCESITLNFQNPQRFLFSVAAYAVASIVCIGGLLGLLYVGILSLSPKSASEFASFLPFSLPILIVLIIVFALICWQTTVIGYSLTFDKQGIKGEYYYCGNTKKHFVDAYTDVSPSEVRYSDLIRSCGDYIVWENFLCFSYHKNCLVLWKSNQPKFNFKTAMLIQFDFYTTTEENTDPRPLRICGTEDEIRELKNFLSGFMPCLPAFGQDCRAIV